MEHRIKNLFAVASGVVMISARSATDKKELARTITSRLNALARTQDLTLSGASTHSTTLRELVRVILAPYDAGVGHLLVEGSDLECGPRTARSLALLLHEFATNSVKYGALSRSTGNVEVEWHEGETITLYWRELGGPATRSPENSEHGFGGVLVAATVSELGGTIERDWQPQGLSICLTVPRARLVL